MDFDEKGTVTSPTTNCVALRVNVPILRGTKIKRFDLNAKIKDVSQIMSKQLTPAHRPSSYHIFIRNVKIDPEITLSQLKLQHMDTVDFMRDPRYEILVVGQPNDTPIYLDENIKTSDAIRKIYDSVTATPIEDPPRPDSPLLRRPSRSATAGPATRILPVNTDISMTNTYTYGTHEDSSPIEEEEEEKIPESAESAWKFSSRPWQPTDTMSNRTPARTFPPVTSPSSQATGRAQTMPSKITEESEPVSPNPASASVTASPTASRVSYCKLSKKVGNGIRQELGELKEFSQYSIRTNDLLELEYSVPTGNKVIELVVDYSPILTFAPPEDEKKLLFEGTRKVVAPDSPRERKFTITNAVQSLSAQNLLKLGKSKKEKKEKKEKESNGVGLPYNVKHKQHVTFDFTWTGQKAEDLFELKNELGKGSYGTVYMATHKETGYHVAIKCVPVTESGRAVLQKEIDVLKKVKNVNVLAYYGMIPKGKECWILTDYCAVGSIKDLINLTVEPLEEPHIVEVCLGALKGLAYLHSQKIIHLDIKAANIMLTHDGTIKLGDFGVSHQLRVEATNTQSSDLIGSPLYMAPEVIKLEKYNSKADIWSLGITLIELAEGRPPNTDVTTIHELLKLPNRPPPTLRKPRMWSNEFNDILTRCLVKDVDKRATAIDLLSDPFVLKTKGPDALLPLIRHYLELKVNAT